MEPTISILGGDLRQVYLARLLLEDGRDVTAWGLEQGGAPRSVSLDRALEGDILLLPLPVCRGDRLNLPLTDTELELRRLWPRLRYDQLLLGGMTGNLGPRLMADYGLTLVDYYAREETQVANAAPTAEGAIQLAMEHMPITIHGARVLVTGFGRVGRITAQRFAALGARVSVAARRYEQLAWAQAMGLGAEHLEQLAGWLCGYDLVVNTIPFPVLGRPELEDLRQDCLILDLASMPGGVDLAAAEELGLTALQALALPGKVAPVTAGAAIKSTLYNMLREAGY